MWKGVSCKTRVDVTKCAPKLRKSNWKEADMQQRTERRDPPKIMGRETSIYISVARSCRPVKGLIHTPAGHSVKCLVISV